MGNVKTKQQIQFRLSGALDLALQKEAARRGMSVNELAKKIVINELTNAGTSTFKADVSLKHVLSSSYNIIHLAVFIILNTNPDLSEEAATEIANKFIFSKSSARVASVMKQLGVEE
ncbi:hypothetical protein GFF61_15730 [Salmonella enterica]|nr:hypothetical protein [Salmonella enterica]EJE3725289.1 hypothetical protein [Salmonella enterica]EKK5263155.1 hypothetical protein [Cronobacter sakazakii]